MINRSSMPRLLRKNGGTTEKLPGEATRSEGASSPLLAKGNKTGLRKPDNMRMTEMVKKLSGSQTHSNLTTEPSLKTMRAPKKQITDSLPKKGAGFGLRRASGGTAQESYVNHGARPDGKVDSVDPIQSARRGGSAKIKHHAFGDRVEPATRPSSPMTPRTRPGTPVPLSPRSDTSSPLPDFTNMVRDDTPMNSPRTPRAKGGSTGNWIKGAIKNPGGLHKSLGIPAGKKIPAVKIMKAEHSRIPTIRKQANLAHTLSGLRRGR